MQTKFKDDEYFDYCMNIKIAGDTQKRTLRQWLRENVSIENIVNASYKDIIDKNNV